ncbi:hypothetical protein G6O69_30170 [Pseudenhygromyxa sp. WMMC2535]|uniref:hypothetical protein n=1 Tax=Pseudenhygromyxa sp. WMMC2535 TaxID=2712867 RepID=UPI0015951818|nr:hypothetical protein [Pseudenhygromyxa sp. WMMC2535]NVB42128.1 hypothetical protein [Pseudenhygromyxa sp. WMMC2535]
MTSKHSKFLASSLCAVMTALPAVLVAGAVSLSAGTAQAALTKAACRVDAIEASPEGDGTIPAELSFLADQLQAPEFGRYKSFKHIGRHDFTLELSKVVEHKFKSGHTVELSLLGGEKDKLELRTDLARNGTSLVNMSFSLRAKQVMLIPVRRGDSAVIFAYQCKT